MSLRSLTREREKETEDKGEKVGKLPYLPMVHDLRGGIGSFKADFLLTVSATLSGSTDTEYLRLYPFNLDQ